MLYHFRSKSLHKWKLRRDRYELRKRRRIIRRQAREEMFMEIEEKRRNDKKKDIWSKERRMGRTLGTRISNALQEQRQIVLQRE